MNALDSTQTNQESVANWLLRNAGIVAIRIWRLIGFLSLDFPRLLRKVLLGLIMGICIILILITLPGVSLPATSNKLKLSFAILTTLPFIAIHMLVLCFAVLLGGIVVFLYEMSAAPFETVAGPAIYECLVGDLQEGYGFRLSRQGRLSASRWYYIQIALSFFRLLPGAILRMFRIG
jgi:hypothetical protein